MFLLSYKSSISISFLFLLLAFSCNSQQKKGVTEKESILLQTDTIKPILTGADQLNEYIDQLKGKRVGIIANQTSIFSINQTHLVDSLLTLGIDIKKVFSPEHGFRGQASAGEKVSSGKDIKTGLPIVSLYGKHKKPTPSDLSNIDVLIFDIQDVGARFYTYISTMHYIMEACAENNKSLIILDRPNPNGFYVDGPLLDKKYESFVGMHPIPVVHGLTIGELAKMIIGEQWLNSKNDFSLTIVTCKNYTHKDYYELPIAPSPNLPNMSSIYAYPSLCFFEGTDISIGRGTNKPFQIIGSPILKSREFSFVPKELPYAKDPKHENETCYGYDVAHFASFYFKESKQIHWYWLTNSFQEYNKQGKDLVTRKDFFDLLAGSNKLRELITQSATPKEIRLSYLKELDDYKIMRKKYLLYEDFE